MKTIQIRHGVFETNSSSTHSMTIVPFKRVEFIENGIIYPGRLSYIYTYYESYGYNGSVASIETKEEKSCLVLNWIRYLLDDNIITKEEYGWLSLMVINNLNLDDLDWENYTSPIPPFYEDNSFYTYSGDLDLLITQTEDHIKDIINNDSVRIVEHNGSDG